MPEEQDRNGIIRQYSVCYQTTENTDPCNNAKITDNTWFELNGLKPYQKITFQIKAATSVGFGPATIAYQTTLPSGMYLTSRPLLSYLGFFHCW
jgi:hypothetical protein